MIPLPIRFFLVTLLICFLVVPGRISAQIPVISSVAPLTAKPGDTITISGTNFDPLVANNRVLFGATYGQVVNATTTGLKVIMDTGAIFGPLTVSNSTTGLSAIQQNRLLPTYRSDSFFQDTLNFRNNASFSVGGAGSNPYIVVAGDLDLDGRPDLVAVSRYTPPVNGAIYVYRNTSVSRWISGASFSLVDSFQAGFQTANAKLADLDGDGLLDVVVTVLGVSRIGVYRNVSVPGTIAFDPIQLYGTSPMGVAPYVVAIDDFNKDGKPDVAATCRDSANVIVFRNASVPGTIHLTYNNTYKCGYMPISLTSGDLDSDGWPDIAVADDSTLSKSVSILKNISTSDTIDFAPRKVVACLGQPSDIHLVDFNIDGRLDIVVSLTDTQKIAIYENQTLASSDSMTFGTPVEFATGSGPAGISVGDLNGDGKTDLVVSNARVNTFSYFRNTCIPGAAISSTSLAARVNYTCGLNPFSNTIVDVNGDTYPDVVVPSNTFGAFAVFRNYPLPFIDTVAGPNRVCITSTPVAYTNSVAGGVWALSNYVRASINSNTGVLTPLAPGIDTVLYYTIAGGDSSLRRLIVRIDSLPNVAPIAGASTICVGAVTTLSEIVTGGAWSIADPSVATLGTPVGTAVGVTGLSGGDVVVSYSFTNSCGTDTEPYTIHVIAPPSPGIISGASGVCGVDSTQLDDPISGGTWSIGSMAIATINSTGKVFGVTPGATTVSYTVSNSCGSNTATFPFSVHVAPNAGVISGATSVCEAANITLSETTTLGSWSSANSSIASVSSAGVVRGNSSGSVIISYTVTNSCGTAVDTQMITVNPLPVTGVISGATNVCAGVNITLATTGTGGVWSSGTIAAATVAGGLVHGVAAGTTIISYSVTNGCGTLSDTQLITVNPQPVAGTITGPTAVCPGAQITLSNATGGGVWSSSATATATVAAGVVTGVAAGNVIISYSVTNICGTRSDTQMVVVNPAPNAGVLSGANTVCETQSVTLNTTLSGGTWNSSAATIATVVAGVVTGIAPGTAIITYTRTNVCGSATDTQFITVNPLPLTGTISGPANVCAGTTISLATTGTGGVWSSGTTSVATVAAGSVGGVAAGTAVISYSVTNGCGTRSDTQLVTVNPQPNAGTISGGFTVCEGTQLTLTNTATAGSWSSGNIAVATVNTSGVVFPVTVGSTIITYTHTNSCGTATDTQMISVLPAPFAGTITGIRRVCAGTDLTLSNTTPGGVWSSSAVSIASVSGGVVHGATAGFANISYSVSNSCGTAVDTHRVQVMAQPVSGTITGPYQVCTGSNVTLTGAAAGGTWSSSDDAVATVAGGVVHGNTPGAVVITYSVTNTCGTAADTQFVTVNLSPDAGVVSGPTNVCAGAQISLSSTVTGGAWSSSAIAIATVTGGTVEGIAAGNAIITYAVTNGCGTATDTQMVKVNPLPFAGVISGGSAVCTGNLLTLTASAGSGVWAASNSNATVAGGVVTAVTPGLDTITYSVINGCGTATATKIITIELSPDAGAISGPATVCAGQVITLSETATGGVWSASNSRATVADSVVTGVSMGNVTISYSVTNSCGTVNAIHAITVDSLRHPGVIMGPPSICTGVSATLTDTAAGGVWSVTNASAAITADGELTGMLLGTDTVMYSVTNGCGTSAAIKVMVVNNSPYTDTISGPYSVCQGQTITLTDVTTGGVWATSDTAIATVEADGVVLGVAGGTVTISYTVTSVCGTATTTHPLTVDPLPVAGTLSGIGVVCVGTTTTVAASVVGGTWMSTNANTSVVAGMVTGLSAGSDTILYIVSNVCGSDTARLAMTIQPLADTGAITGPSFVCEGTTISLANTVASGTWTTSAPGVASVSLSGVVNGIMPGTVVIGYTVGTGCAVQSAHHLVTVRQVPALSSSILPPAVCDSTAFNYNPSSVTGGVTFNWSRAAVAGIANVAATGTYGISEVLDNTTPYPIAVVYQYITSASGCADTANVQVTVKPTPQIMQPLLTALCGDTLFQYTLSSLTPATTFAWTRNTVSGIAPASASGTGSITDSMVNTVGGIVAAVYTITLNANGCTNTQLLRVMLSEGAHQPHITTRTPSAICQGMMYQNFGTNDSLYPGEQFTWTAANGATVWAVGAAHKYALVNFSSTGMAWVYLSNTQTSSGCTLRDSFAIWVEGGPQATAGVVRLGDDFICQDNDVDAYQWGYDDKLTLDSTLLSGETNQNYYNASPDLSGKFYWVITSKYGCSQKSYYNAPVAVTNVNATAGSMVVSPNPNNGAFQVFVSTAGTEPAEIIVADIAGRTVYTQKCTTNSKQQLLVDAAAGVYFVTVRTTSGIYTDRVVISK